ncbi:MAG: hypothetical protein PVG61_07600 [Dehalococcoidia bacterium]|jgi:hypothetical protein
MVSGTVVWLIFFVVLFLVAVPASDRRLRKHLRGLRNTARTIIISLLVLGIALIAFISIVGLDTFFRDDPDSGLSELLISLDNVFGYNDATSLSHQAAQNLLDGKNPYEEANIIAAMIEYNGEIDKITPLREGRFADVFPYPTLEQLEQFWEDVSLTPEQTPVEIESKFNYPAGGFLLPAPFLAIGIDDFRFIYIILLVPVIAYVIYKLPSRYRIHFIIAMVASLELWNSLAAGETGFLYFPFLFLGWILYKKNWWASALFLAGAIVIKQLAWFVLPFYLILIFRTKGWRQMALSLLIIATVFFAANGYFLAKDPGLWINSVAAPVTDNMFPLGVGIVSIVSGGYADIQSPLIFTILELAVAVAAVLWYFFKCYRYPETGLLLSVLPLFFAWRSLWGYFFYVDVIILASILINEYGTKLNGENAGLMEVSSG